MSGVTAGPRLGGGALALRGGAVALLLAGVLSACESADQRATESVADQMSVCAGDARAVALPGDYPAAAKLPDGVIVTHVEKREGGRTVVSAVSAKPFKETLKALQATFSAGGWKLSEGEVEDKDAESNFAGNGMKGRWAIRAMESCAGNTAVSLVTGKAG